MSRTRTYHTTVTWTGEHWGHLAMGNGPEMAFSAPPDAQGHSGVLTPEDAFVAAANTCVMMMFIWATERFRLDLQSYERSLSLKRSVAQMNIIMTQVLAAATKASSGVSTPACPWASGGAENSYSGPFPMTTWPQCSPFHSTVV